MNILRYTDDVYRTDPEIVSLFARIFPALAFYGRFLGVVWRGSVKAKRGQYGNAEWCQSSLEVLRALEKIGVQVEVAGIRHVEQIEGPCVVIGNHMSMLETVVLPVVVQPVREVTFVVKQSLLDYPVFRHIMRSRHPIAVTQTNPRQDFKTLMAEGVERLNRGISVIVFPQGMRTPYFDPAQFNTSGVKLAQKAKVPIVPLALLTDAWENGKYCKDFGRIDPSRNVRFAFGEPMQVQGRGTDEHRAMIRFIEGKLQAWKDEMGRVHPDAHRG